MKVLNKSGLRVIGKGQKYIGRPTKWGNPYVIGEHGTREEVVEKYAERALMRFMDDELLELEGLDLVCYCAPQACHGDVLVRMVAQAIKRRAERGCEQDG